MKCPECRGVSILTVDSRPTSNTIRRRRMCQSCGCRWTTHEVSQIAYEFYLAQLERVKELEQQITIFTTTGYGKHNRGRLWTKSDEDRLKVLYYENVPYTDIAKIMNRSYKSIENKVNKLKSGGWCKNEVV